MGIQPTTCFCKYSYMGIQRCHSFTYYLWLLLAELSSCDRDHLANIFTLCSFAKKKKKLTPALYSINRNRGGRNHQISYLSGTNDLVGLLQQRGCR